VSRGLLLVGLDNPQSSDPRYALFPHPSGCAGHRLMKMMQEVDKDFTRREYVAIPKTNLFPAGRKPRTPGPQVVGIAGTLLQMQLEGTKKIVVLLGNEVRDAVFNPKKAQPKAMVLSELGGTHFAWIPHPSGRNPYYNDTRRRRKVARFLHEARKLR